MKNKNQNQYRNNADLHRDFVDNQNVQIHQIYFASPLNMFTFSHHFLFANNW